MSHPQERVPRHAVQVEHQNESDVVSSKIHVISGTAGGVWERACCIRGIRQRSMAVADQTHKLRLLRFTVLEDLDFRRLEIRDEATALVRGNKIDDDNLGTDADTGRAGSS